METWDKLPLNLMDELAERESYRRDVYRPVYSIHKWWARRPGSTFRMLGLAALTDENTTKEEILRRNEGGAYDGKYLQNLGDEFEDEVILDPFAGGGTTLVELNRLGAQTIGYELNPVAWWAVKKTMDGVDISDLRTKFDEVVNEVRQEIGELYTTQDPQTGGECEVLYSLQTQRIPCLTCEEDVDLFPRYKLAKNKKTTPAVIFCPNNNCDSRIIELNRDIESEETCPNCGHSFDPNDGNCGYGKYTCSNGHKHDIKETLDRLDEKPSFEYFALQYVTTQGDKKFKELDKNDEQKIAEANQKLNQVRSELPIPQQKIPNGDKTDALRNYNYEYFSEMFSDRQLLTFGKLFARASEVESENIREFLYITLSNSLNFASKLCRWHAGYRYGLHIFERHAFVPRSQPVEANILNRHGNMASIESAFSKVENAKEYCERPFEKLKNPTTGDIKQIHIPGESIAEERNKGLYCKTSENLEQDDESVDYVITDPPYYDNVQYSELSDYYYVWLQQVLNEDYDEFDPELVPKAREIVSNTSAGKDERFFIEGLSNVFSECHRVLKPDGELIFTYHHNENEAWSVILEALIDSGFTITGAYPVQSEYPNNTHINKLDNAEYDILIFANKQRVDEEITLTELQQNLFFELQDMADEERERHENLSKADLGVILRGKCMFYYSCHYPNVYSEGAQAGIDEALETVDSIIEQALEGSVNLPQSIDPLSQAYAAFCQRGWEEYDDLNKHLLAKNLNVDDLEDEKLVKGPRDKKEPSTADERIHYIESKLNKNGKGADGLLDIDKVQYLYHLYKTDQNTVEYLKKWKSDDLEDLADFMADITDDDRYESVMEMGLSQF